MLYGMDDMITLEHLTKIYGQGDEEDLCVLEDVSLSIKRGKFTVLLGPSGSGKSTLLNLIAMLDKPTSGKIFVDGEEITALKSETARSALRLQKMGFVFQFDGLLPEFSLLENVDMPALMKGNPDRQKAQILLENLGLGPISHKLPADLSGGEKQRASIARAIRNEPALLLADEPTGNLDSTNTRNIVEILQKLAHENGCCVIIVTHDPAVAEAADVVLKMKDGSLNR